MRSVRMPAAGPAVAILLLAGGHASADVATFNFARVGQSYSAAFFADNPLVGQEVMMTRIFLELEVEPGADAAEFSTDIVFPLEPFAGNTNVLVLTGEMLGWTGSGRFTHMVETTEFNGVFIARRFGAETLPMAATILEGSRIEMVTVGSCWADIDGNAVVDSRDFFGFLTFFFSDEPRADFNGDALINSADFFDFIAAFFAGC